MNYTTLGRTDMKVSVISFGGIPIQRGTAQDTMVVVDELIKAGVNYIDTARGYTVSEGYLGEALVGRREKFYLATKSMVRDYMGMKQEIQKSLSELKTDYIDLYQLHNIKVTDFALVFSKNGAYEALLEAKEAGIIRHIGATAHGVDALKKLVKEEADKIETVMFPYNLVENQGEELLKEAREKGIGTIAMKPLAGGNITEYGLALRYIIQSKVCDIAIPGMGSAEEVRKNLSVDLEHPLTIAEQERIQKIRKELGETFCRRCGYCAPCTVGIDIPSNFLMANYLRHYEGLAEWARTRYDAMAIKADACVECGACEARCPYQLPIRKMLKDVAKEFAK